MNTKFFNNFATLKPNLFLLPLLFSILIVLFLFSQDALHVNGYVQIQKDWFYFINHYLGQYPSTEYNLTQFGDASVLLSFLIILVVYAPKIWEALLSALLVSLIFSKFLKTLFLVPRPARVFDTDGFIIVGKKLQGFNSLPSGHSITIFTIFTVLMFGFMPQKITYKISWVLLIITTGLLLVFTRVAIGAHYPLDVISGSIIGYTSGLLGVFISRKYTIWTWINNKKYYPIFMLTIIACGISLLIKIFNENLVVFYAALISLFVALYKFIYVYFKK
jgi:membrane-associated phospholipid phosphatase